MAQYEANILDDSLLPLPSTLTSLVPFTRGDVLVLPMPVPSSSRAARACASIRTVAFWVGTCMLATLFYFIFLPTMTMVAFLIALLSSSLCGACSLALKRRVTAAYTRRTPMPALALFGPRGVVPRQDATIKDVPASPSSYSHAEWPPLAELEAAEGDVEAELSRVHWGAGTARRVADREALESARPYSPSLVTIASTASTASTSSAASMSSVAATYSGHEVNTPSNTHSHTSSHTPSHTPSHSASTHSVSPAPAAEPEPSPPSPTSPSTSARGTSLGQEAGALAVTDAGREAQEQGIDVAGVARVRAQHAASVAVPAVRAAQRRFAAYALRPAGADTGDLDDRRPVTASPARASPPHSPWSAVAAVHAPHPQTPSPLSTVSLNSSNGNPVKRGVSLQPAVPAKSRRARLMQQNSRLRAKPRGYANTPTPVPEQVESPVGTDAHTALHTPTPSLTPTHTRARTFEPSSATHVEGRRARAGVSAGDRAAVFTASSPLSSLLLRTPRSPAPHAHATLFTPQGRAQLTPIAQTLLTPLVRARYGAQWATLQRYTPQSQAGDTSPSRASSASTHTEQLEAYLAPTPSLSRGATHDSTVTPARRAHADAVQPARGRFTRKTRPAPGEGGAVDDVVGQLLTPAPDSGARGEESGTEDGVRSVVAGLGRALARARARARAGLSAAGEAARRGVRGSGKWGWSVGPVGAVGAVGGEGEEEDTVMELVVPSGKEAEPEWTEAPHTHVEAVGDGELGEAEAAAEGALARLVQVSRQLEAVLASGEDAEEDAAADADGERLRRARAARKALDVFLSGAPGAPTSVSVVDAEDGREASAEEELADTSSAPPTPPPRPRARSNSRVLLREGRRASWQLVRGGTFLRGAEGNAAEWTGEYADTTPAHAQMPVEGPAVGAGSVVTNNGECGGSATPGSSTAGAIVATAAVSSLPEAHCESASPQQPPAPHAAPTATATLTGARVATNPQGAGSTTETPASRRVGPALRPPPTLPTRPSYSTASHAAPSLYHAQHAQPLTAHQAQTPQQRLRALPLARHARLTAPVVVTGERTDGPHGRWVRSGGSGSACVLVLSGSLSLEQLQLAVAGRALATAALAQLLRGVGAPTGGCRGAPLAQSSFALQDRVRDGREALVGGAARWGCSCGCVGKGEWRVRAEHAASASQAVLQAMTAQPWLLARLPLCSDGRARTVIVMRVHAALAAPSLRAHLAARALRGARPAASACACEGMCLCGRARHALELRREQRGCGGERWAGPPVRATHAPGFCRQVVAGALWQLPCEGTGPGGCVCESREVEEAVDDPDEARKGARARLQSFLRAPAVLISASMRALFARGCTEGAEHEEPPVRPQTPARGHTQTLREATMPHLRSETSVDTISAHEGIPQTAPAARAWLRIPAQALIAAAALLRAIRELARAESQHAAVEKASMGPQAVALAQLSVHALASRCTALIRGRTHPRGRPAMVVPLGCDEVALLAALVHSATATLPSASPPRGCTPLPPPPTPGALERGHTAEPTVASAASVPALVASEGIRVPLDTLARALAAAMTVRPCHRHGEQQMMLAVPAVPMLLSLPPPSRACGAPLCTALALARACDRPRGFVSCRLRAGSLVADGETRSHALAAGLGSTLLPEAAAAAVETSIVRAPLSLSLYRGHVGGCFLSPEAARTCAPRLCGLRVVAALEIGEGPAPVHVSVNEDGADAAVAIALSADVRGRMCARVLCERVGTHVRALASIANALFARIEDEEDGEHRDDEPQ